MAVIDELAVKSQRLLGVSPVYIHVESSFPNSKNYSRLLLNRF